MTQYGFYYDSTRCSGCRTCVLACKDRYDLDSTLSYRNVIEYGSGSWTQDANGAWSTDTSVYHVSVACNHCANPACVAACPQSSMAKHEDTGLVYNDPETCIGCGSCVSACPYGAPGVNMETMKSVKCTGCADRVAEGKAPICVEACSMRALEFGDIEELRAKYGTDAEIAPLPAASITGPSLCMKLCANARPAGDTTGAIINESDLVMGA